MKKILSVILALIILFQLYTPVGVIALTDRVKDINDELAATLGYMSYYTDTNRDKRPLNTSYIENGWIGAEYPAIVYGTEADASAAANAGADKKGSEYRCIGFAKYGDLFSNPDFPADFAMSRYADTKNFISNPWTRKNDISLIKRMLGDTPTFFDADELDKYNHSPSLYRRSIALGIGLQYGIYYNQSLKGKSAEELQNACSTLIRGYKGNMVSGKFMDPDMHWEEYCHIIQPPTQKSWGAGILFHENGGKYYYFDVLLPPLELTPTDDLSVKAVTVPTEVGLRLKAEPQLVKASFTMPDSNVIIRFRINNLEHFLRPIQWGEPEKALQQRY